MLGTERDIKQPIKQPVDEIKPTQSEDSNGEESRAQLPRLSSPLLSSASQLASQPWIWDQRFFIFFNSFNFFIFV